MAKKQKKNFKRRRQDFDNRKKFCKFTSMGIDEIDYILGDPYVTPDKDKNQFDGKIFPPKNKCPTNFIKCPCQN